MPGLKGTLCDEEGFPRADLDIPHILSMKGRISCLQTDLSDTMHQLEAKLIRLHELTKDAKESDDSSSAA